MKIKSLFLGLALTPALFASEPTPYELSIGSTLEQAKAVLGVPRGDVTNGEATTYFFAAGEVTFKDGKLISCSLKSTAELAEQARVAETMKKESADRTEKARAERLARGERLRAERAKDPAFLAQPASARLASWREFRAQFPEINVQAELDSAYREWQVEASEQQLAELKNRLASLSAQLAAKEREAADLRADRDAWKNRFDDLNSRPANIIVNRGAYTPVVITVPTPTPVPRVVLVPPAPERKQIVAPTPVPAPLPAASQSQE